MDRRERPGLPARERAELATQYGDWDPHLFVYYTTNGYTNDDDNVGGYNQTVDGWKQVSSSIFPATRFVPVSERGGRQTL